MSEELDELKGYDAIDITGACVGGSDAEKKEEAGWCTNGTGRDETMSSELEKDEQVQVLMLALARLRASDEAQNVRRLPCKWTADEEKSV
ncbi:hypothetical protein CTRI78_v004971 [Colletotrichum trifolii]|uniref:Uncharacterized protein n=1 Tax=Colletotrichum trifolii TaxID=5466 RepID=A0A4R8RK98_COLTR|nr:hypothetical protein CTRI78_v004971 [Colletotrichum trifolii]